MSTSLSRPWVSLRTGTYQTHNKVWHIPNAETRWMKLHKASKALWENKKLSVTDVCGWMQKYAFPYGKSLSVHQWAHCRTVHKKLRSWALFFIHPHNPFIHTQSFEWSSELSKKGMQPRIPKLGFQVKLWHSFSVTWHWTNFLSLVQWCNLGTAMEELRQRQETKEEEENMPCIHGVQDSTI